MVDIVDEKKPLIDQEYIRQFSDLVDDTNKPVTNLQEEQFVRVFLPVLANHLINKVDPNLDISVWATVANGYHRPVNVVNSKGEILFVVPPIYGSTSLHSSRSTLPLFELMANVVHACDQVPTRADEITKNALDSNVRVAGDDHTHHLATWAVILERYGYPNPWIGNDSLNTETADSTATPVNIEDPGVNETYDEV